MCSIHIEGKFVAAEEFISALKNNFQDHNITAVPKNIYFDVLDNIVNKYNTRFTEALK